MHFLNENIFTSNTIWLKFVDKGPIDNNTTLVQIMAWRRAGDYLPLSELMMASVGAAYMRHSAPVSIQNYYICMNAESRVANRYEMYYIFLVGCIFHFCLDM